MNNKLINNKQNPTLSIIFVIEKNQAKNRNVFNFRSLVHEADPDPYKMKQIHNTARN